jgi:hypothetical protein
MYVRVDGEYRAPARIQQRSRMLGRWFERRLPVADPRNRHSNRYFLVPARS